MACPSSNPGLIFLALLLQFSSLVSIPTALKCQRNLGSVSLVVSLLSGNSGEFAVQLTASTFDNTMVDNQALAGLDYEERSAQLVFPGVDQNFDVTLINDDITEMVEIFSGALVSPILIGLDGSEIPISAMDASRIRIAVPEADVSITDQDGEERGVFY